jgi:hypothetical protein
MKGRKNNPQTISSLKCIHGVYQTNSRKINRNKTLLAPVRQGETLPRLVENLASSLLAVTTKSLCGNASVRSDQPEYKSRKAEKVVNGMAS